jgi:hypothetical protein
MRGPTDSDRPQQSYASTHCPGSKLYSVNMALTWQQRSPSRRKALKNQTHHQSQLLAMKHWQKALEVAIINTCTCNIRFWTPIDHYLVALCQQLAKGRKNGCISTALLRRTCIRSSQGSSRCPLCHLHRLFAHPF